MYDEDEKEDFDEEYPIPDDVEEDVVYVSDNLHEDHVRLEKRKLNQELLDKAINFLSKSWFWKFRSTKSKMNKIVDLFMNFKSLVEFEEFEEE